MNQLASQVSDKKDVLQLSYELAQKEYNDLWDSWKHLEAKAQATLATAGIFEAGAFAYATQAKPEEVWIKLALLALIVFLTMALCFAVLSIKVKALATPFQQENPTVVEAALATNATAQAYGVHRDIRREVENSPASAQFQALHAKWTNQSISDYSTASLKVGVALEAKAAWLRKSLNLLFVTSLLVPFLVGGSLFTDKKETEKNQQTEVKK